MENGIRKTIKQTTIIVNPTGFGIAYIHQNRVYLDKCADCIFTNLINEKIDRGAEKPLKVVKNDMTLQLFYGDEQIGTDQKLS